MTDFEKLTQASTKQFSDKKNNAVAYPCSYFISSNGLAYLIKNTTGTKITCAFHITTDQVQQVEGLFDKGFVECNSTTSLCECFQSSNYDLFIIEYKGITIGVNKQEKRIELSGTYHYFGEVIENRNGNYIVLNEAEAQQLYLSNSMTKWLSFGDYCSIPVYPSYLTPVNVATTYITVEIENTKSIGIVHQVSDTVNKQYLQDKLKLYLTNATLNQAQEVSMKLNSQAEKLGLFGFQDLPNWTQINDTTQSSFGIKTNLRFMDLTINYQLLSDPSEPLKYIIQSAVTMTAN